jgi:hypothetical protein
VSKHAAVTITVDLMKAWKVIEQTELVLAAIGFRQRGTTLGSYPVSGDALASFAREHNRIEPTRDLLWPAVAA